MTVEQRKEYLIKFLCDMGCYDQFLYNCKHHKQGFDNDLESLAMVEYPYNVISRAFTWMDTVEGRRYWEALANEFKSKFIIQ